MSRELIRQPGGVWNFRHSLCNVSGKPEVKIRKREAVQGAMGTFYQLQKKTNDVNYILNLSHANLRARIMADSCTEGCKGGAATGGEGWAAAVHSRIPD